jgi:hypothetical protein
MALPFLVRIQRIFGLFRPTLNLNSYLNESTATFNTSSGTGSALTDVSFSDVDIPTPAYNISRIVKTYEIINNVWEFTG